MLIKVGHQKDKNSNSVARPFQMKKLSEEKQS